MADDLRPEQRKKNMQHIRSKDTKAEIMFRKALWTKGIRYRKNFALLPGKPDIAITKHRIAIFVDGDFWHARGHEDNPGEQIGTNKEYWIPKLKCNVERDRYVDEMLLEQGWLVLRFWESDVKKDLDRCLKILCDYLPM